MRIFIRFFSFILIPVLSLTILMFYNHQKQLLISAERELLSELKSKWELIEASGIFNLSSEQIDEKLAKINKNTKMRITFIARDGNVIKDSLVKPNNIPEFENHTNRPEIMNAFLKNEGIEARYSSTSRQKMFYYARILNEDGVVLRVAYPMHYIESLKKKMKAQAYTAFFSLFTVFFAVLLYVSLKITKPIVGINKIVKDIEQGKPPFFPRYKDKNVDQIIGLLYRTHNAFEKHRRLLESEKKKLRGLVNLLEEGIIKLDENGLIELANKRAETIFGCFLNIGDNLMNKVTDKDAIVLADEILSYPGDCTKVYEMQQTVYEIYVRSMEDSKIIVLTNITDSERYRIYKSELITNISHELKTPLALVMGYAETLQEHPNMKKEDRDKFLNKIFKGTTELNQLINDVIELHRYESSSANDVHFEEETNINEYADEIKEYYSDNISHELRIKVEGAPIRINKAHLNSLVTNLVENAMNYSGQNFIELDIRSTLSDLFIDVSDGGPAIPVENRERIFERFYTVSKSRNRNKSSTGLGLSIVKHICRLYRGEIVLEVNKRGGNRFKVQIVQPE